MFTKKDFWLSVLSGLITGFLAWRVFDFIPITWHFHDLSYAWLVLLMPILWVIGVWLGYFLSRWFLFLSQFGKFAVIGFTNFAVDSGIFYLLVFLTGETLGTKFKIFKGISFLGAVVNSFFWNKYWAFGAGRSRGGKKEIFNFFVVNVAALLVNVGVASLIANGINPLFSLSDKAWAGLSLVAGSGIALVASFIGFRLIVFREK